MLSGLSDHRSRIHLRPNDFDWSRFLNNAVYPELFEFARWDWAQSNGIELQQSNIAAVVVRMEIDYKKPIFWDPLAQVFVDTSVKAIERFSFTLSQVVKSNDEVHTVGALKLSLYDFVVHRILPISHLI